MRVAVVHVLIALLLVVRAAAAHDAARARGTDATEAWPVSPHTSLGDLRDALSQPHAVDNEDLTRWLHRAEKALGEPMPLAWARHDGDGDEVPPHAPETAATAWADGPEDMNEAHAEAEAAAALREVWSDDEPADLTDCTPGVPMVRNETVGEIVVPHGTLFDGSVECMWKIDVDIDDDQCVKVVLDVDFPSGIRLWMSRQRSGYPVEISVSDYVDGAEHMFDGAPVYASLGGDYTTDPGEVSMRLQYMVVDCGGDAVPASHCSGEKTVTAREGEIYSQTAGVYNHNSECLWYILPEGMGPNDCILLHFLHLDTEIGWDPVFVYDGDSARADLLPAGDAVFTLNDLPTNHKLLTSGPAAAIYFISDYALALTGFHLTYGVHSCNNHCETRANCDECSHDPECSWCSGDVGDYSVGKCVPLNDTCPDTLSSTADITQCPGYPVDVWRAVNAVVNSVQPLRHIGSWYDVSLPDRPQRYTWCQNWGWDGGTDHMFTCDEDNHLVELFLHEFEPFEKDGTISEAIGNLTTLRKVHLNRCKFGSIPHALGKLPNLIEFAVIESQINDWSALSTMSMLRILTLRDTRPRYGTSAGRRWELPDISALTQLEELQVVWSRFSQPFPGKTLERMTNLHLLHLGENLFYGDICAESLSKLTNLRELHLNSNNLEGDASLLFSLPNLQKLDLERNQLLGGALANVTSTLIYLNLEATLITGSLDELTHLHGMRFLLLGSARFYGTLPRAIFDNNAETLQLLSLNGLGLHGSLPAPSRDMRTLGQIHLQQNSFTGEMTKEFCTRLDTIDLVISDNQLDHIADECWSAVSALYARGVYRDDETRPFPAAIATANARVIDASVNRFTGTVPEVFSMSPMWTESINLSGNFLEGTLPRFATMNRINKVDLSSNRFTRFPSQPMFASDSDSLGAVLLNDNMLESETFPESLELLTLLAPFGEPELNVANNRLRGDIGLFASSTKFFRVDLSHNALTGEWRRGWFAHSRQHTLRLSHNQLSGDVSILSGSAEYAHIAHLDLSHNQFHGSVLPLLPVIEELDVSHNKIAAVIDDDIDTRCKYLTTLDISHNDMMGTLPVSMGNLAFLKTMSVTNNPRMFADNLPSALHNITGGMARRADMGLPPFLSYTENLVSSGELAFTCPTLEGDLALGHVDLHASYYAHIACSCAVDYYGQAPNCQRCPEHAVCPGDTLVPFATPDWFGERVASTGNTTTVRFHQCRLIKQGETACVGVDAAAVAGTNRMDPNECARGYQSRLCSECEGGFFKWGLRCRECNDGIKAAFPIALAVAIVAVYGVLFKAVSSSKGTLKILVFHLQMISFLSKMGNPIPTLLLATSEATSFSNLSIPGVECYASGTGLYEKFVAAFVMPLVLLGVSVVVFVSGMALRRVSARWAARTQGTVWLHLNVRVYLFLVVTYYLSLSRWLFSVLPCDNGHMNLAPYIACGDGDHRKMTGMAAAGIVLYVLGLPAMVSTMLWRNRTSLDEPSRMRVWGFLYSCYKKDLWWWELVVVLRKLAIVMVIAFSPYNSATLPVMVFSVLVLSAALQHRFRPFNSDTDNRLELVSLATIMVTYHLALTFFIPDLTSTTPASVVVFLANLGFVCACVVVLTRRKISRSSFAMRPSFTNPNASPLLVETRETEMSFHA